MNELDNIFISEYPESNITTYYDKIKNSIDITTINFTTIIILFYIIYLICNKSIIITIIIFSIILIFYGLYKNKINAINETKKTILYPKSKNIEEEPEIYNFLFSVQEFYNYNPQNYTKMIINIDKLLLIYKDIKIDNKLAGIYYYSIKDLKYEILNLFQSFIYKIPSDDNNIIKKYNEAKYKLEEILDKYTDEIYKLNKEYIIQNGINYTTTFLSNEKLNHPNNESFGNPEKIIEKINKII